MRTWQSLQKNIGVDEASLSKVIGKSVQRVDALGKVSGKTLYPGDINHPEQLHAKLLFARRPHAIVRSIDSSKAEALDGVIAIFTAKAC